ncbi:MAG: TIGR00282 family metallophosphoesterase [Candidatus Cloacimonas sp.]
MKVLFFGDVYGKAGRQTVQLALPTLKEEFNPDFIIANGENIADGKGVTEKTLSQLFSYGIDAVTGGNHLWDRNEAIEYIRSQNRIVKPLNYPEYAPGNPFLILVKGNLRLGIICLCGQLLMPPCDNPFNALDKFIKTNYNEDGEQKGVYTLPFPVILDFHTETTSEKRAMGWFADGKLSAVLGTHTHIQTADEEILPAGTAYITDVGMTGSHDSVIGVKKEIIVDKFRTSIPIRYESSDSGLQVNAVVLEINSETGLATKITRVRRTLE